MRARLTILTALAGILVFGLPALAGDEPAAAKPAAKPEAPPVVDNAKGAAAVAKFRRQFDTPDLDFQLDAVIDLGKVHHPKVAAELLRLLKNKDPEVQAEAMKALGRQHCYRKKLERRLVTWLDEKTFSPRLVAQTVRTIGQLDVRKLEEDLIDVVNSPDDEVAIAALRVLGDWRSYKSLRDILLLWEFYPEDGKWSTGSVTVDTGASGSTDQRAAKAKWKAKYGGRAKRGRPELVQALRKTVNKVIGLEDEDKILKRPKELREWISDNKVLMRKHR